MLRVVCLCVSLSLLSLSPPLLFLFFSLFFSLSVFCPSFFFVGDRVLVNDFSGVRRSIKMPTYLQPSIHQVENKVSNVSICDPLGAVLVTRCVTLSRSLRRAQARTHRDACAGLCTCRHSLGLPGVLRRDGRPHFRWHRRSTGTTPT